MIQPSERPRTPAARVLLSLAFAAVTTAALGATQRDVVTLDGLLAVVSQYVARFDAAFSNVISEEHYVQTVGSGRGGIRRRELVSDFLMVKLPTTDGWIPFRDVFEVDRNPVRDREDRLVKLLANPDPTSIAQAMALVDESARYNIGVYRTMNLPILALQVLRPTMQVRFRFSGGKPETVGGVPLYRIDFSEQFHPSIITGVNGRDLPMRGQLWVDANGVISKTELWTDDPAALRVTVTTEYRYDPSFEVSIPLVMREEYEVYTGRTSTKTYGVATYGHFRRFGVETSSEMGGLNTKK